MTLFKGGTLVTSREVIRADLRVEGELIKEIGNLSPLPGEKVYQIEGKLLFPGIIDAHTHFLLRARNAVTADDVFSGGRAAALGGVTTVIDYADMLPGQPLLAGIEHRRSDFVDSVVDYSFHLVVNDHYSPDQAGEFSALKKAGIASIKLFTTYKDAGYMLPTSKWQSIMAACRQAGVLVTVHAEDDVIVEAATEEGLAAGRVRIEDHPDLRPGRSEAVAVEQLIGLARTTQCPVYIVHLSSSQSCRLLQEARKDLPIIVETTPHYLLLDRSLLRGPDGRNHLMTPPLREPEDNQALWQGVIDGTISVIATDHCAFTPQQKAIGTNALDVLPGIPGVETLLPLIYTYGVAPGRIQLHHLIQLLSENPARIFGLWPRKGRLEPGADADLVVYDPQPRWTLTDDMVRSRAGYSSFAGMELQGRVYLTLLRGRVIAQAGELSGTKGWGQFVLP